MKKLTPFFLILLLFFTSLACNFGAKPKNAPTPVETDACCLNEAATPEPQSAEPAAPQASGLEPGWHAFTNANAVREVIVQDGILYAATLGGMTTWNLEGKLLAHYTPQDGMGHVSANSIVYCEIPAPRILVGTLSGISVFDPQTGSWTNDLPLPEDSRLAASKIERLYCDQANNRLLIGSYGLSVLDLKSGELQQFTSEQGLRWDSISDITVLGTDIWVAHGYKGIAQISKGKVTAFGTAEGLPDEYAYSLATAPDGTLWIGASSGLISYKAGKWVHYDADSPSRLSDVHALEIAPDGEIWAATLPLGIGRLCQFQPDEAVCAVDFQEKDNQGIFTLALTESGVPVYGTGKGLYRVENGAAQAFQTPDFLASNFVDSLASAPDGKLWVGTDAGIQVLNPAKPAEAWQTFRQGETDSMGGNWGKSIAFDKNQSVWFAFTNGSASRYQNGNWTTFPEIYSFDAVAVDEKGRAWFGDDSKGVVVLNPDGTQAMTFSTANGLPGDNVQAIVVDLSGRVWIGTDQGLAKVENDVLEVVFGADSPELPNKYIRALAVDSSGALLIGTFTGVVSYDGTKTSLLLDFLKAGFSEARLTTLAVAPDNRVWIGTDKGLLVPTGSGWELLTTADGLLTNYISALHVDSYGAVWVGGGGSNFDGGGMLQIVP